MIGNSFSVAGCRHYTFISPQRGENLVFVPEPFNPRDPFAVAVYNVYSQKMGYVPKRGGLNLQVLALLTRYIIKVRVIGVLPNAFFVEITNVETRSK